MSVLIVIEGSHAGRRFNLGQRTRIGRALDNEIVLTDHLVSRYHTEILLEGSDYILRDLGSKNGISLNRAPVTEKRLARGDVLQVGLTRFLFEVPIQSHTAHFSDHTVHLDALGDEGLRLFSSSQLPTPAPAGGDLAFLFCLGRLFGASAETLPEALNDILTRLMERFGATAAAILTRNGAGDAMPLVAVAPERELHFSHDAIRQVLAQGKAALTSALGPAAGKPRPRRALIAPLPRRDRVFGVLALARPEGKEFTPEELGLLQAFSSLVSAAVHHAIQIDHWVIDESNTQTSMIIGGSAAARAIREQVVRVAASDATVLLTGETGTGKELVARALHAASPRASGRFVAIDCSAIPASLMESELFGHEAGAFTGADRLKPGKVEMAEGGTLFLDEIGEMQIELQPKLLRFLEELVFSRVGGIRPLHADVRIIAATNRDLEKAVAEGRFRDDLRFRLNVMPIHLPPLRERIDDIRPLINYFAPQLAARLGKAFLGLDDAAWTLLEHYPWPGNVRELHHGLERALILADDGVLRPEYFQLQVPLQVADSSPGLPHDSTEYEQTRSRTLLAPGPTQPPSMATVEAEAIRRALRYAAGNRGKAAEVLKIHRNTLAKKIQEYGIEI